MNSHTFGHTSSIIFT